MILGVTGGIASGKSSVVKVFAELGASVVSADQLAREAVAPGSEALQQLSTRFGSEIIQADGQLDRKRLGDLVFADEAARQDLNAILHPAIAVLSRRRLRDAVASGAPLVVYEAPLLFEAHAEDRVDAVLVVTVDEAQQLERLIRRDNLTAEQARARMAAQMPQAEKASRADYLLDNSGPWENTRQEAVALFRRLADDSHCPSPDRPEIP